MMRTTAPLTALVFASSLLFFGCGEPEDDANNHDHHANHHAHGNHDTGGTEDNKLSENKLYHVHWTSEPAVIPHNAPFDMEVTVHDADHKSLDGEVSIAVDATMPAHGHGMEVTPAVSGGPTTFQVEGMKFHMMGDWEFVVNVDGPAGEDTAKLKIVCCAE